MSRYKIVIQYDGTNFSGFQSQKNQSGIQDNIEYSISKLNNDKKIKIYGASRTDAGVHALGQVAHFNLDSKFSESELLKALNARLSKEIRISHLTKVNENFHSRFDATSKEYHYLCSLTNNPLHLRNHFQVKNLDFDLLLEVSEIIEGKYNFLSFSKFSNKKNNFCRIFKSKWVFDDKKDEKLSYIIHGDRFLHHMVRYLVGTMIAVSQKKISINDFKNLLSNPKKDAKIFKAPGKGLVLKEVFYEN